MSTVTHHELTSAEYLALAGFRGELRKFLHFSENAARGAGIEPQQHQLLLALKGLSDGGKASVGDIAQWLQIRHHSAVELVDRAEEHGLVYREQDPDDRRRVLVALAEEGQTVLRELSVQHWVELQSAAPALLRALQDLMSEGRLAGRDADEGVR